MKLVGYTHVHKPHFAEDRNFNTVGGLGFFRAVHSVALGPNASALWPAGCEPKAPSQYSEWPVRIPALQSRKGSASS